MIESVRFVGLRTSAFAEMTALYRDHLGLVTEREAGIEFIGDPQRDSGAIWNHYRAPDGNVYELMGREPA